MAEKAKEEGRFKDIVQASDLDTGPSDDEIQEEKHEFRFSDRLCWWCLQVDAGVCA